MAAGKQDAKSKTTSQSAPGKPEAKGKGVASGAPETANEAARPAKKGGKRFIVMAALSLLAIGIGAGAWHFMGEQDAGEAKATPPKPPVFVALEAFTVNLQPEDGLQHYLQAGITLRVADQAVVDAIKLHMPEIRNRVLMILSAKKASDLLLAAGKERLAGEILEATLAVLAPTQPASAKRSPAPVAAISVAQAATMTQADTPAAEPAPEGASSDATASEVQPEQQAEAQPAAPAGERPESKAEPAAKRAPPAPVQSVLFTAFIIQ